MDLKEITENIQRHPWELSRGECIFSVVKKFKASSFADVGAGDRFFTKKLLKIDASKIYAVDSGYTKDTTDKDGIICLNDVSQLKDDSVDCLILMDVLEHIEKENEFLSIALNKLTENGIVLITVPAWQFLFSSHDEFVKHYRRYNRRQLLSLLKTNGLAIKECHYFYTSLFFARLLQKVLKKTKQETEGDSEIGSWEYDSSNIITLFVKTILSIDFWINKILDKIFIHLPGLSIMAICKKAT